ncbi:uncharacterized protein BDZ83DRAFT_646636 [Colletotrichum acutatum]|uniref:Uncharacterized protein n=1 Tax=Glomerella acutata TaxID=27357 RepID=A0AAD8XNM8_GLOAC|nr:uncharacterized protein BDZ83DRAFT_646636 [Colletotrichum acutatum]KAK1730738.1 hypothetical protein BDZ83DRAFT_646636 [Colletotrichum acutatum]
MLRQVIDLVGSASSVMRINSQGQFKVATGSQLQDGPTGHIIDSSFLAGLCRRKLRDGELAAAAGAKSGGPMNRFFVPCSGRVCACQWPGKFPRGARPPEQRAVGNAGRNPVLVLDFVQLCPGFGWRSSRQCSGSAAKRLFLDVPGLARHARNLALVGGLG